MATVVCDKCKTQFTLGKPKHRWIDKDKDIALKYQQLPEVRPARNPDEASDAQHRRDGW